MALYSFQINFAVQLRLFRCDITSYRCPIASIQELKKRQVGQDEQSNFSTRNTEIHLEINVEVTKTENLFPNDLICQLEKTPKLGT